MKYQTALPPYSHQIEALREMGDKEAYALLMAMRTGKTKVLLDNFGELEAAGKVDDLFVIAPAGVYHTWVEQIRDHVSADLRKRLVVQVWEAGTSQLVGKKAELQRFVYTNVSRPRALIMNIEALSSVSRARKLALSFAGQRRAMIAIDESTKIKSPDSERSRFVVNQLRRFGTFRRILTGLPSPNSPLDLFAQFYFLDPSILRQESFVTYRARYADVWMMCTLKSPVLIGMLERAIAPAKKLQWKRSWVEPRDLPRDIIVEELQKRRIYVPVVPMIKGFKNEEELHKLIKPYSFRVTLAECYDMPAKVYMKREVSLTTEQKRIYKELRERAFAELEDSRHITARMVLTRVLRLHQVLCGHVPDDTGEEYEIKENRTAEVLDILEEYDGKAIVWCSYDADIRKLELRIKKIYGDDSVARFWGGNPTTRETEEKWFKKNPQTRFMLATPSAGGMGRQWDVANLAIYFSNNDNLEYRLQSEERTEAIGKKTPVAVVDIIAPGTVDEKIINSLREKQVMSNKITGDNWRDWI